MEHIAHDETSFVRPAEVGEMELYHAKTWLGKYVFSQDAKTIAIQYAATAIAIGMVALVLSWFMRLQLAWPNTFTFIDPAYYLQAVTMHGMIMVVYLLTALFLGGFGNYLIPLMVGARDMVFPWLNMISFWVYFTAVLLLAASFFVGGGSTGAGWTLYPPQAILPGTPGSEAGILLMLASLAVFIIGFTMGGLNYVVTILQARTRGMTLMRMPLTVWGIFVATMAYGGTAVVMRKFDCARWLGLAQQHRATHTILVPVQYQRLMDFPQFDEFDLSSMALKYCTSAPFSAELKAEVVRRMPGALIEIYSMTEGGVVCLLRADTNPDKLHTVGIPWGGSEVFTIDEQLNRLPAGEIGELVGRSTTMMSGYQNQPEKTEEASWYDDNGERWQRMGDIGRVDEEGFVTLLGRSKDMIISGGFNIYPRDLEDALLKQPEVVDAAVIGIPSKEWGETPLGFVVAAGCEQLDLTALCARANSELGKTQRISALKQLDELPRSHIGKILKTALREMVSET